VILRVLAFSILLVNTAWIKELNYHIFFDVVVIFLFLIMRPKIIITSNLSLLLGVLICLWPFLSVINDGSLLQAFGKSLKLFVMISLCWVTLNTPLYSKKTFFYFMVFHIALFGITFLYWDSLIDKGIFDIPRFSGALMDANMLAGILSLMLFLYRSKVLIFLIIATQSLSVIFAYVVSRLFPIKFSANFLYLVIPVAFALAILLLIYTDFSSLPGTDWWSMRIYSLSHRFTSSISGLNYLYDNYGVNGLLFGMGSSRSYEFTDRVLHSFYTQGLVDHGFIFVLLVGFFFTNLIVKLNLNSQILFFISIISFSFDPFVGIYFSLFIFMVNNFNGSRSMLFDKVRVANTYTNEK